MVRKILFVFMGAAFWVAVAAGPVAAQQGRITGQVTSTASGGPLAGVQVYIQALDLGGLSQANGRFLMSVPPGAHTVTASRIGYGDLSSLVTVGAGQTVVLDFLLTEDAVALDEILVTGTAGGTQRRAIGNVVERLDVGTIADVSGSTNIQEVLGARVPGLYMVSSAGQAGLSGQKIRIRGVSSLGVSNDPIVFVDGIRMSAGVMDMGGAYSSRLNDINPNDIESIEVIKGPAAATLYGTEAANGVVQIITKKGVVGAPVFSAALETGVNWFQNPAGFFGKVYGTMPSGEVINYNLYKAEDRGLGGFPQNTLFQNGPLAKVNLSVRGGTDLIRYYASIDRGYEEGFVGWNVDKRLGGRLSLDITASDKLNIAVNGSFLRSDTRGGGGNIMGVFRRAHPTERFLPGYETRGFQVPFEFYDDYNVETISVDRDTWSIAANFNPVDWLATKVVVGKDRPREDQTDLLFREPGAPKGHFRSNGLGYKRIYVTDAIINTMDFSTTASYQVSDGLGTATSFGVQYYTTENVFTATRGDEFATGTLSTVGAAANTDANETFVQNKTLGGYIQEQFDWQGRFFLTAAIRADDNSAFGTNFDIATYPKVSATWVTSEEEFWGVDFIDPLRVRAAWGQAGQQPDAFASSRLYRSEPAPGGGGILTPDQFGNPDLGPEKGQELEVGFDAGLFDGKVNVEFSQYWKTTKNAIISQPVIESTGFSGNQFINAGEVKNWGTELGLGIQMLDSGPLRWDLGINASRLGNEVSQLGDTKRILISSQGANYQVEGFPLAGLWTTYVVSADPSPTFASDGTVINVMCDAGTGPLSVEGTPYMRGGPAVDCADAPLLYTGRSGEPTWIAQISNTFTLYDNLRLFVSVDGRGGAMQTRQDIGASVTTYGNVEPRVLKDNLAFQAQVSVTRIPLSQMNTGYINLREIALQYTLPESLAGRMGASRVTVRGATQNVLYLWRESTRAGYFEINGGADIYPGVKGRSPETTDIGGDFGGHTHNAAPPLGRATLSLNFTF